MSFGFSVGDFIAALELVGTVVTSLRETGGAKSQFRELTQELFSLEQALLRVKQLEFEEHQYVEYVALKQAASQCRHTIDQFWTGASRYQKHLLGQGKASAVKTAWLKVQWTLFKADELARFKTDIAAHTQSILVLLATLQMQRMDLQSKSNSTGFNTLRNLLQESFHQCYDRISQMSNAIGGSIAQGEHLIRRTTLIFQTNIRIFQTVCSIHTMLSQIPQGVERQQPVYMIDALGKTSPFHLDFVRSADAFRAVLKFNFEKVPSGLRKIESGEFRLHDQATGRLIDLSKEWATCFLPGQRIEMRMVFNWTTRKRGCCPACGRRCPKIKGSRDTQCKLCGLTFARILRLEEAPTSTAELPKKPAVKHIITMWSGLNGGMPSHTVMPRTSYDESNDVQHYRRVHIVSRKRREIWHEPAPVEHTLEAETLELDDNSPELQAGSIHPKSDTEGLEELEAVLETDIFEQLLEMDGQLDDVDEREFSRSIMLGLFEGMGRALQEMLPLVYSPDSDLSDLSHWGHNIKGGPYTIGLTKLGRTAWEIQVVAGANLKWMDDEFKHIKTEEDQRVFVRKNYESYCEQLAAAKVKLYAFYKVPLEVE